MKIAVVLLVMLVSACANTTTGVVPIGGGQYMASKVVHLGVSGSAVKAALYQEAAEFCSKSGKGVAPITSTSQDAGLASYASAEIQFRCD